MKSADHFSSRVGHEKKNFLYFAPVVIYIAPGVVYTAPVAVYATTREV